MIYKKFSKHIHQKFEEKNQKDMPQYQVIILVY